MMKSKLLRVVFVIACVAGCANANLVGGRNYVDQGVYDKAVSVLEGAVMDLPNDPEAHYLLGKAYVHTNQYEKAAPELAKAAELDPGFYALRADTIQSDVYAQLFNAGNEFLSAGQYADALDRYKKAMLFGPDKKDLYQNLGFVYTKLGQRQDAIRSYRKMFDLDRNNVDALRIVLGLLSDAGEREEAFAIAKEILQNKPGDTQILGMLADMYYADADSAKARGDVETQKQKLRDIAPLYEAVLQKDPANTEAMYQLGLVNYQLEDFGKAATYFESTLEATTQDDVHHRDALYNLAVSYIKSKQYVLAELRLRDLIAQEPAECDHYRLLNATLREQKRSNEALEAARKFEECSQSK
ncbi:MAG: tetratricopeptide repeat protein [bacterium]